VSASPPEAALKNSHIAAISRMARRRRRASENIAAVNVRRS